MFIGFSLARLLRTLTWEPLLDQYLPYFIPYILIGFTMMLAPFASDAWPRPILRLVEFSVSIVHGIWVGAIVSIVLLEIGLPMPLAMILSYPATVYSGLRINAFIERDIEMRDKLRREAWEAHRRDPGGRRFEDEDDD